MFQALFLLESLDLCVIGTTIIISHYTNHLNLVYLKVNQVLIIHLLLESHLKAYQLYKEDFVVNLIKIPHYITTHSRVDNLCELRKLINEYRKCW